MNQFHDEVKRELGERLYQDLLQLGFPVDEFDIEIRRYSVSLYGNYLPVGYRNRSKALVRIYPYKNREGALYPYDEVLIHAIHESCHHLQYRDKNYTRRKGIMHDSAFYKLLDEYCIKAKEMSLIEEIAIKRKRKVRM